MRPLLTADEMRVCEMQAIREWGIFSLVLQEHAAMGALSLIPANEPIHVLAGPGNNGGDALALARLAKLQGRAVEVWATSSQQPQWKGDAAVQSRLWEGLGGGYRQTNDPATVVPAWRGWAVDGIFGLGARMPISQDILPWIAALANPNRPIKVLALDLPTGLNPDSGGIEGPCIRADLTACFGHLKRCHGLRPAREACGITALIPIPLNQEPRHSLSLLAPPMLQKPKWDANKYDKGHIAIRAGTCGMSGAAVLAAMGALSGGAGLVTLLPDPAVADAVASQVPEAIVRPWEGFLPNKFDVLLVGPGGVEDVPMWDGPLVVDASALKDGEGPAWMSRANAIITPHAGEFSRLFSQKAPRGTQERVDALANHQCGHGGVLVLKGAQTFITGGGSRHLYANPTGHAGLATGGSGDFLAGLLAARYANNPESPLKAAQEAVWLHGAAADKLGKGPLLVRELASSLAGILREKERG